ncbi:MAG TPA: hypothetical protein VM011_03830 [Gammaproteobacteria bacterium]|nr:hypothetical protein [Gammaproteobacteria bacterium]
MRYAFAVFAGLLLVGACQVWSDGPGEDRDGDGVTGETGLVDQAAAVAQVAGAAGVPYAALGSGILGIICTVGAWFTTRQKAKLDGHALVEVVKPILKRELSANDFDTLMRDMATTNKLVKLASELHEKLKAGG